MKFNEMKLKYRIGVFISCILLFISCVYTSLILYKAVFTPTNKLYISTVHFETLTTLGLISFVLYTLIVLWKHRKEIPTLTGGKR